MPAMFAHSCVVQSFLRLWISYEETETNEQKTYRNTGRSLKLAVHLIHWSLR